MFRKCRTVAVTLIALSSAPTGVFAEAAPVGIGGAVNVTTTNLKVAYEMAQFEPVRRPLRNIPSYGASLQRPAQKHRGVGRAVLFGALIGAGAGAFAMASSPECKGSEYCGPWMLIGVGVGAGAGAGVGFILGRR